MPADADTLRLQARLAAAGEDFGTAIGLMSEARTRAGESWTDEDEQMLEEWQQVAAGPADATKN